MTQKQIQDWLTYWTNARLVSVEQIQAFEHVNTARRFCSCMRVGVFANVSDLDIWRALVNMRDPDNRLVIARAARVAKRAAE